MQTRTGRQDTLTQAMGNAVKILRKRTGIAQERIAQMAGIDRSHMSSIERGVHTPTLLTLAKLLPFLDSNFEEFGKVLDAELDRLWGPPPPRKKNPADKSLAVLLTIAAQALRRIHHFAAGTTDMPG